jgi:hypothetical protein
MGRTAPGRRPASGSCPSPSRCSTPGTPNAIAELAAELQCVLVVLDTQARVTVGADENSAVDMGRLVAAAEKIRVATRACVKFVHHEAAPGQHARLDSPRRRRNHHPAGRSRTARGWS